MAWIDSGIAWYFCCLREPARLGAQKGTELSLQLCLHHYYLMAPAVDTLLWTVRPVTVPVTSLLDGDGWRCGDGSVFSLPAGTRACLRAFLVFSVQENSPEVVGLVSVGPVQGEPVPPAQPWTERKWSRRLFSCATHLKRQYRLGSSAWVKRLQTRLSFDRRSWLEHKWNKWLWKAFYWFSVKLIRQNSFMILGQIKT